MSATIYTTPEDIKVPTVDFSDMAKYRKDEQRYINEVVSWCKKYGSGNLRGEEISIPHADSAAYYVIQSLRPLVLLNLNIGDAWDSPHADLLTAKRVKEMVENKKAIEKLFPPRPLV